MPYEGETENASQVDSIVIRRVLGAASADLIEIIAKQAQERSISLYLVGGVVRDLLLNQRNLDLDFVLESDASGFANQLASQFGGSVQAHKPFGTATWSLDSAAAEKLSLAAHEIPDHIDFARARSETYTYPTALPSVTPGDIQHDLRRRDFTLNTLAIQLSPEHDSGRLLDHCGGLSDLQQRLIRVLHDDSFTDDPTRILRVLRLAVRLQFEVEAHTAKLMRAALPMLGRISGKRLCNEIDRILREPRSGEVFLRLQELGVLTSIHASFRVSTELSERLESYRGLRPAWSVCASDWRSLEWLLLMADVNEDEAHSLCQRLDLSRAIARSIVACTELIARAEQLRDMATRPSEAARLLDGFPEISLCAVWLLLRDCPAAQQKLEAYVQTWRHQRASINGDDLKRMGIPPGPQYKHILERLRFAWIDGDVKTKEEENALLLEMLSGDR